MTFFINFILQNFANGRKFFIQLYIAGCRQKIENENMEHAIQVGELIQTMSMIEIGHFYFNFIINCSYLVIIGYQQLLSAIFVVLLLQFTKPTLHQLSLGPKRQRIFSAWFHDGFWRALSFVLFQQQK